MANQNSNRPQGNQSRQPANQASQSAAGATETMVRNESLQTDPSPPATHVDEVSALRDQVAQLTSMVANMLARESGAAQIAAPVARSNGDLNVQDIRRAMYDDERERKLTQRRMQAERSQQRAQDHVAFLRNAELELQDGPRMYEVAIPGEPRSMRLVGSDSSHGAFGKYMESFQITGFAPDKRPSVRELSQDEIPEITKKVQKLVKVLVA